MGDLWKIKPSHVIPEENVSTLFTAPYGYEGTRNLGIVRGISVRTRNVCTDIFIACNALFGGSNYFLVGLYHDTRQEAYNEMIEEAHKKGANSVIGVHYESTEIGVLCYGTAIIIAQQLV